MERARACADRTAVPRPSDLRGLRQRRPSGARPRLRSRRPFARLSAPARAGGHGSASGAGRRCGSGSPGRTARTRRSTSSTKAGGRREVETGLQPSAVRVNRGRGQLGRWRARRSSSAAIGVGEHVSSHAYSGRKSTAPFTSSTTKPRYGSGGDRLPRDRLRQRPPRQGRASWRSPARPPARPRRRARRSSAIRRSGRPGERPRRLGRRRQRCADPRCGRLRPRRSSGRAA